jgi:hypothetical protein
MFAASCQSPAAATFSIGGSTQVMATARTLVISNVALAVGDFLVVPYLFVESVNTGYAIASATWGINNMTNTGLEIGPFTGTTGCKYGYATYQCTSAGTHDVTITVDLDVTNGMAAALVNTPFIGSTYATAANNAGSGTSVTATSSALALQPAIANAWVWTDQPTNIAAGTWDNDFIDSGTTLIEGSGQITFRNASKVVRVVSTYDVGMVDLTSCNSSLVSMAFYGGTMPGDTGDCCACPTEVDPASDPILDGQGPDGLDVKPGPRATIIDSMASLYN